MQMVAALSTDGSFLSEKGKGSIEDASLFYVTSNPLQKIAFDAFRHKNAIMVIVKPQPFAEGHMSIMTMNGKPLAFKQVQDEILVFDEDETIFNEEDAVWLEERHYNRFRDDYGMQIPNVKSVKYGLRLAGYLTEEDRDLWAKAQ